MYFFYCQYCREIIKIKDIYCKNCGSYVEKDETDIERIYELNSIKTTEAFKIILLVIGGDLFSEKLEIETGIKNLGLIFQYFVVQFMFIVWIIKYIHIDSEINLKILIGKTKQSNWLKIILFSFAEIFLNFLYCDFFKINLLSKEIIKIDLTWWSILSSILMAPILEEIIFRGFLFQKLSIKYGIFNSIIFSSLIFALVHFDFNILGRFFGAVILCLIYIETQSLIVPILSHSLNNILALVISKYGLWVYLKKINVAYLEIAYGFIFILMIFILISIRRNKNYTIPYLKNRF